MSEELKENQAAEGAGGGRLIRVDIDREMRSSFLDYSMSVIVDRALPDVRLEAGAPPHLIRRRGGGADP